MSARTVTRRLLQEHRIIGRLLNRLEAALEPLDGARLGRTLGVLEGLIRRHRRKEETLLFPVIDRWSAGGGKILQAVRRDHGLEEGLVEEVKAILRVAPSNGDFQGPLKSACLHLIRFFRDHLAEEEALVFPAAERDIPDDVKWEVLVKMDDAEPAESLAGEKEG